MDDMEKFHHNLKIKFTNDELDLIERALHAYERDMLINKANCLSCDDSTLDVWSVKVKWVEFNKAWRKKEKLENL